MKTLERSPIARRTRPATALLVLLGLCFASSPELALGAEPCSAGVVGNIHLRCRTYSQVYHALPCGVTGIDHPTCGDYDWDPQLGCQFGIGDYLDPDQILVEWWADQSCPSLQPNEDWCFEMWASLTPCGPPESPEDPDCPDPVASGVCQFNCQGLSAQEAGLPRSKSSRVPHDSHLSDGQLRQAGLSYAAGLDTAGRTGSQPESLIAELWNEQCRAIVLMPEEWQGDPWTAARGFFTIGRTFPPEALGWPGEGAGYGVHDALLEGQLGPLVLSPAGASPLWGGEGGRIDTDWEALKEADLCINSNALLASPYWKMMQGGFQRRRALVRCQGNSASNGMDLYFHSSNSEEDWKESGALASEVRGQLEEVRRSGLVPVCVTAELAELRRTARSGR